MRIDKIKRGRVYSDGKTARMVTFLAYRTAAYVEIPNGRTTTCFIDTFARWAKFECQVVLELE